MDRPSAPDLSPGRLILFSALLAPLSAAGMSLTIYVPALYAQVLGLSLTTLGGLFLLSRLWDAAAEIVIGALCDRTGRCKPWIASGVLVFAASSLFVFLPTSANVLALALALCGLHTGWAMINTPHGAWSAILGRSPHERTRIQSYIQALVVIGLLSVLAPFVALDQQAGAPARMRLTLIGALVIGGVVLAAAPLLLSFPEPSRPLGRRDGLPGQALLASWRDRALRRVLLALFLMSLAQTTRGSLFYFFVARFMGLPQWTGLLFLIQLCFALPAPALWRCAAHRIGGRRAVVVAELVQAGVNLALLLVLPGDLPLLMGLTALQGLAQSSGNVLLRAMVGDLASAHHRTTGVDRVGAFFAAFSFSGKVATALALGTTLPLLALAGFDPAIPGDSGGRLALRLSFILAPASFHVLAALATWRSREA